MNIDHSAAVDDIPELPAPVRILFALPEKLQTMRVLRELIRNPSPATPIWMRAAELAGWRWSAAYAGFINERERRADGDGEYIIADEPQDACYISGIETLDQAQAKIDAELEKLS